MKIARTIMKSAIRTIPAMKTIRSNLGNAPTGWDTGNLSQIGSVHKQVEHLVQ